MTAQKTCQSSHPSRVAAALLLIAAMIALSAGFMPHVLYRMPLALIAALGLWRRQRWAYVVAIVNAVVWLLLFMGILPFLLTEPPWALWFAWFYWLVPTGLVVEACVLMRSKAGRAQRAAWMV